MREIKFRGLSTRDGGFAYGDLMTKDIHHGFAIVENGVIIHPVDPDTVGQFTGLTDRNGAEIYEGDIVLHHEFSSTKVVGVVEFNEDSLSFASIAKDFKGKTRAFNIISTYHEIIGNIHQNKDLIK